MKKLIFVHKKEVAITLLIGLCYCILGLVYFIPTTPYVFQPLFKGYLTLLVRSGPGLNDFLARLKAEKEIEAVIAYETAPVSFTSFGGMDTVTIAALGQRFDQADPRLDPYLKQISAYFIQKNDAEEWHVVFLRTGQNPASFYRHLKNVSADSGIEWQLYEFNAQQGTYLFMLFNLFYIILILFLHKDISHKILTLAAILPWTYCISLGAPFFMLYLIMSFYLASFVSEYIPFCKNYVNYGWQDRKNMSFFLPAVILGILVLLCLFMQMFGQENIWEVMQSLFFSGAALLSYPLLLVVKKKLQERQGHFHVIFNPLSLVRGLGRKWQVLRERRTIFYGLIGLFACSPLLFLFLSHHISIPLPTPVSKQETEINMDSLRRAALGKEGNLLPDLTDYIIHMAYQEGLDYGQMEYKFPEKDQQIMFSTYMTNPQDKSIRQNGIVAETYDNKWFSDLLAGIPPASLEKLLLDQGTLVTVGLQKPRLLYFDQRSLWTIIFLWCIFLCPLILFNYLFTPQKLYGIKMPLLSDSKE